jgi:hypothetical protein
MMARPTHDVLTGLCSAALCARDPATHGNPHTRQAARELIERSPTAPTYDSQLQADPYVDHNKVVLSFTCR